MHFCLSRESKQASDSRCWRAFLAVSDESRRLTADAGMHFCLFPMRAGFRRAAEMNTNVALWTRLYFRTPQDDVSSSVVSMSAVPTSSASPSSEVVTVASIYYSFEQA